MSAFQSTFDSLRGFPRRLSDAAREVRRTASLAGAAMAGGAEPGAQPVYHRGQPVSGDRLFLSGRQERARSCTARGWPG